MECNSSEESTVETHKVINALRPTWPKVHVDVDLPGWFIILAAMIIGLRGTCPA
jgi:hypothetical protein